MSTVGHSDFSHGIPGDFASRLIRPGTQPRRTGPYEISRGNTCPFHTVPPAHTLLCPGGPSTSFAAIVPARYHLNLADRFALFGYGPVLRRKPFGPHLTVGALSCAAGDKDRWPKQAQAGSGPQAGGAHPGRFLSRRPCPLAIARHLLTSSRHLVADHARRGVTPAFGYRPRLDSV